MGDKTLEIFKLGITLAQALQGEQEAIADIKSLYKKHPEMFKSISDLVSTIQDVAKECDFIMKNPKAKNDKDYIAVKALSDKKMGDIGLRNENGTNIIFHANKKKISEFKRLKKLGQILVETPSANAAPTRLNHCVNKSKNLSKCGKAPSIPARSIVTENLMQSQAAQGEKAMDMLRQEHEEKDIDKEFERKDCDKNKIKKGKI